MFGSGGLIVCNDTRSVVDLTRTLVAFDQMESCGKLLPVPFGNDAPLGGARTHLRRRPPATGTAN